MAKAAKEEPATEETTDITEGATEPTMEQRATQMGWKTEDVYKGDPANWSDAETFVKKAEEETPLLRSNLRKLQIDLHTVKADNVNIKASMDIFIDMTVKAKLKAAEKKMDQAVVDGDTKKYEEGKAEYKEASEKPKDTGPPPPTPEAIAFMEDNPWYGVDEERTEYAVFLDRKDQGKGLKAHYANIAKKVEKHFATPAAKAPSVEGGGATKNPAKGKKGWASIPAEAKPDLERLVRSLGKPQAEIAELYWSNQDG